MAKKSKQTTGEVELKEMQQLYESTYLLFLNGSEPHFILSKLEGIELAKFGDYNCWIYLRALIMLKCHLSPEDEGVQVACRARVAAVTNGGGESHIEAFNMLLEGNISGLELLNQAKMDGDIEWERDLYMKIISQLVIIVEMGASRKFGYGEAVKTLEQAIKEAKRTL